MLKKMSKDLHFKYCSSKCLPNWKLTLQKWQQEPLKTSLRPYCYHTVIFVRTGFLAWTSSFLSKLCLNVRVDKNWKQLKTWFVLYVIFSLTPCLKGYRCFVRRTFEGELAGSSSRYEMWLLLLNFLKFNSYEFHYLLAPIHSLDYVVHLLFITTRKPTCLI